MKQTLRTIAAASAVLCACSIAGEIVRTPARAAQIGVIGKIKIRNELRQTALLYNLFYAERLRPPRNLKEFSAYIRKSAPTIKAAIDKKKISVELNVKPLARNIVAYQTKADRTGHHMAVMGDRSTRSLTTAALKKSLKKR